MDKRVDNLYVKLESFIATHVLESGRQDEIKKILGDALEFAYSDGNDEGYSVGKDEGYDEGYDRCYEMYAFDSS